MSSVFEPDKGPSPTPGAVLFQHDCAPVHKARSIKTWMAESGVDELDWPAQSPDLNPTFGNITDFMPVHTNLLFFSARKVAKLDVSKTCVSSCVPQTSVGNIFSLSGGGWSVGMAKEEPHTSHFKEEEEEHSVSHEWSEELPVVVKSEDDEVRGEREEKREAEPPAEGEGDHCGGDKMLAPLSDSDETTSHSPDIDDEDSKEDNTHLTCSHCDKTFKYPSKLISHMRTHTGEKPFFCSVCGKGCAQKNDLKAHMQKHTGVKPFTCSVCGKGFARKYVLKHHMESHPAVENTFPCSICGKVFLQANYLKKHTRTHTGEKPFPCSVCGKGFGSSQFVKAHMRTHTGEKPFPCSVCRKGFTQRQHVKEHERTHTGEKPHVCSVCGKPFARRHHLITHMRTHTGEKVLSCGVCGERLSSEYQGKKHKCAGEKVLSCGVCGERLSSEYQGKKHKCAGEKVLSCGVCGERLSSEYQGKKHKCAGEDSK